MKMNDHCLPCLVNQMIKVAEMTNVDNKQELYREGFKLMSQMDFNLSNPEIIGALFSLIKQRTTQDPYRLVRKHYNQLLMEYTSELENSITHSHDPFNMMVKYAIAANIIDFSPLHHNFDDLMKIFHAVNEKPINIDHSQKLYDDLLKARTVLYIGDNCGEIVVDKLFLKTIRLLNEHADLYFAVRGAPVINDSISEDAYLTGIDEYATIIDNGDDSLGTVLSRVSQKFLNIYNQADVIICKGSANFESLSEANGNRYFLMMVKCDVIASYVQAPVGALLCLNKTE